MWNLRFKLGRLINEQVEFEECKRHSQILFRDWNSAPYSCKKAKWSGKESVRMADTGQ